MQIVVENLAKTFRVAEGAAGIGGASCLCLGIVVLQATSTFWTIQTLEVWNAFTYGGNYAAQYPMAIYRRWFQRFFTAVIPLALTSYYPGRAILGRDPLDVWHVLAPFAGLAVTLCVFAATRRPGLSGS